MLKIIKIKAVNLDIPQFLCDDGINPKLSKYSMLSHFNKYCFTALIGKPGSGKTSLLISWLLNKNIFKKMFHHVIIIMPSCSIGSIKKNPFKDHPEDKIYNELTLENITKILERIHASSKEGESTLLIMDDVGASLKNNSIRKCLRELIYNRRHLKCSIICLLQSYLSLEKEIRKLFNNIIMFKPSKVEFQNLFDELFEMDKHLAMDIMELAYDKPHNYLMLNVDNQKIYKNFDEIEIIKN